MANKTKMGLGTLNTILNTAPLIIQGASRLIRLIRERNTSEGDRNEENKRPPDNIENIREELTRITQRLDENSESDVEQIKLIEQLAKQNELLATSLKKNMRWGGYILIISMLALGISLYCLIVLIN